MLTMASKEEVEYLRERIERLSAELESASGLKKEKTSPAFLLMPSQKRIKSFTGKEGDVLLEDWLCDIHASIASRPLADEDKVHFMFQHLEGAAREEVKLRPECDRNTVEKLVSILQEVFGVKATGVQLQRQFFECKQRSSQSLRDFSHHLMELLNKVVSKCNHLGLSKDRLLCDQFAEGVSDQFLRKHLKKQLRDNPSMPFLRLRREATEWAEEDNDIGTTAKATVQEARSTKSTSTVVDEIKQMKSLLDEQRQVIREQQSQINQLLKATTESIGRDAVPPPSTTPPQARAESSAPNQPRPYCEHCQRIGHRTSACYKKKLLEAQAELAEYRKTEAARNTAEWYQKAEETAKTQMSN